MYPREFHKTITDTEEEYRFVGLRECDDNTWLYEERLVIEDEDDDEYCWQTFVTIACMIQFDESMQTIMLTDAKKRVWEMNASTRHTNRARENQTLDDFRKGIHPVGKATFITQLYDWEEELITDTISEILYSM